MPIIDIVNDYMRTGQPPSNGGLEGNYIQPEKSLGDQSSYNFNSRVFPLDLGMDHNKHYVVFNINVPVSSKSGAPRGGSNYEKADFTAITPLNELSKVDQLRFGESQQPSFWENLKENGGNVNLPRYTRRITESIAMHMPTPLTYTSSNIYEDISLTSLAGQTGKLAATTIGKAVASSLMASWYRTASSGLGGQGSIIPGGSGNIIGTGFQLAGMPINPRIEVLFANTLQRQFAFEFLMAPRNEEESFAMDTIIRTFKFHGAPAIDSADFGSISKDNSWLGLASDAIIEAGKWAVPFYIPPAEFDITFFNNGVENTNIPRINTCVLERIEVDYQPQGLYATFSNGYPVAARLSMAFRETEVVHKLRVAEGF